MENKIRQYVVDALINEGPMIQRLQCALEDFKTWDSPYNRQNIPDTFEAFIVFCRCLPSSLNLADTYEEQRKTLISWRFDKETFNGFPMMK